MLETVGARRLISDYAFKLILLFAFFVIDSGVARSEERGDYAGSDTCIDCHLAEHAAWKSSHHAWAWRHATDESVIADFNETEFTHQGITTRFFRRDGAFWIETDGPDETRLSYEVKYTVGVTPLQQYLIETEGGRLQTLDIAWDTQVGRWFMVFPNHENNVPGNALHWTGVYKNWNGRCAECHSTGFEKGYDTSRKTFDSTWAEIGAGCESCHGPAGRHVALARQEKLNQGIRDYLKLADTGLPATTLPKSQSQEIAMCAACHSRRTALTGDSGPHGADFADHYDLALLRPDLYFPDGQIKDEVFVLGSFYQSKMYGAGVQCSDCHDPHSNRVKMTGNGLCAQCHGRAGNARFPQLSGSNYDNYSHMRHQPGTSGGQCVDCHMPERTYMQVDPRRDHRFGIPSPQDTIDLGVPNACTKCHADRDPEWAVEQLAAWRPDGRQPVSNFGWLFHRVDNDPAHPDNVADLVTLIESPELPEIVRASAIERLSPYAQQLDWAALAPLTQSPSVVERLAAVRLFSNAPPIHAHPVLARALSDEMRSVRIVAARGLLSVPASQMPEDLRPAMQAATQEFFASLESQADHPNTHLGLAGVALGFRNAEAARASVMTALEIDPQLSDAWIMRARIEQAMMRPDLIEETMSDAQAELPDAPEILNFFGNYLFGQRRHEEAERKLSRAYFLSDGNVIFGMDYARLLMVTGRPAQARDVAQRILTQEPDNVEALILMARALGPNDQTSRRKRLIERIRRVAPDLELPEDLREPPR